MSLRLHTNIAAIVLVLGSGFAAPAVLAQAQPQHDHNHPQGAAPGQPAAPPAQGAMPGAQGNMQGGMMGCPMMGGGMMGQPQAGTPGGQTDMKQMMPMMQNMMTMMSAHAGMMAPQAEGRIAALKAQLKITEAQTPHWNRFAEALRATARSMNELHHATMPGMAADKATRPLPDQFAVREQAMVAHLAAFKAEREALQPLYASFSDEQKKIADSLRIGPMGMM